MIQAHSIQISTTVWYVAYDFSIVFSYLERLCCSQDQVCRVNRYPFVMGRNFQFFWLTKIQCIYKALKITQISLIGEIYFHLFILPVECLFVNKHSTGKFSINMDFSLLEYLPHYACLAIFSMTHNCLMYFVNFSNCSFASKYNRSVF